MAPALFNSTNQINDIVVGNGYIIVAGGGGILRRVTDDATPTSTSTTFGIFGSTNIRALCHNGSVCIAVGESGKCAYSTDTPNATWNDSIAALQAAVASNNMLSAAWGSSKFCVVGVGGYIATSPDGATWTQRASGASIFGSATILKIRWVGSKFVAMTKTNIWGESTDGITWTANSSPVQLTTNSGHIPMDACLTATNSKIAVGCSNGDVYTTSP